MTWTTWRGSLIILPPPRSAAGVVASAVRPPSLLHLSMRPGLPHLSSPTSSHSSLSSFESGVSVSSVTPLTSNFNREDIEKYSLSSKVNLREAIAQDLAILQPVEEYYHCQRPWWLFFRDLASLANLTLAVLDGNELILAVSCWLVIGGLHVGCALATFVRIILYVIEVGLEVDLSSALYIALLSTGLILPFGLTVIVGLVFRPTREQYHNAWEYTHRYIDWFVADLIVHLAVKALTLASPIQLFCTSLPYPTVLSVASILYVWFTVRRACMSIRANKSVAVLTFPGTPTKRSSTFTRISRDGRGWHAFSVAMADLETKEFSLIVAGAGDWTTKLITNVLNRRGTGRMWIR
ncbi:hypothetical protein FRC07_007301, partial [Ceratobasidium sp. 392]